MGFRITRLMTSGFSLGEVLALTDDRLTVRVFRDVDDAKVKLTFTVIAPQESSWQVVVLVPRRLALTVADLCIEVHAAAVASSRFCLPTSVQHAIDEAAFALAAHIAELPTDGRVSAELVAASWGPKA
jgi:hypothetical protein